MLKAVASAVDTGSQREVAPQDRRGSVRLEALGTLHGQLVPFRIAISVREVSLGGFSIETVFPLPLGAFQSFRFTLRSGAALTLRARIVHCRAETRGGKAVYVIGLEYVDSLPTRRQNAQSLIDEIETTPQL